MKFKTLSSVSLYLFLIIILLFTTFISANTYTTVFENPNPNQKSSKIASSQLKCPKMKVDFCYGGVSDQCKIDSDCKIYGENQKCCLRVGVII
ncbi:hypothetical protein DICPUDRAFT_153454 [Dictyostelium purpureum]|uniref:WAP domain-containing protein n=1 Tax=Dictyostelium purpureum TaxID=5786 RepID=F0ZNY6_DICPU|nr:uncharacterized protein DICPUDRAFT_153454 [Dictyostelium purpureum]EGC34347.1 hypothetical protein DICPUDRAFT_153454 [Dictyostelium purpureum]|eukprot:XP_003289140.1 hypothetical protein DICPUDRAFT_153454 [Dictyostelium purpureum]